MWFEWLKGQGIILQAQEFYNETLIKLSDTFIHKRCNKKYLARPIRETRNRRQELLSVPF